MADSAARSAAGRPETHPHLRIPADKPKLFNQIDSQSRLFFVLNKHLPTGIRDGILVNHMDIKVTK
ncbi:hypothetical protein GCM10022286_00990 [Gryllotalpicola daejeonensis]|uniref:Uncharacterized protein n=1 Tax=Gryllotalpicola daejeonensis TaxID=993087 RepID=A0ABP7ZGL0_9MICO